MFTGIIEAIGMLELVEPLAAGCRLTIRSALDVSEIVIGESIAVDGACMTTIATAGEAFTVELSAESLRRTTLGFRTAGDRVNLERSMRLGDRLGGHLVTGHVDGTGRIAAIRQEGESAVYTFDVGAALSRLLVEKGSVAVDGISLTCFRCEAGRFDVAVIPHTAAETTLGAKQMGDRVNIENDLLAKYVERLVTPFVDRARDGGH